MAFLWACLFLLQILLLNTSFYRKSTSTDRASVSVLLLSSSFSVNYLQRGLNQDKKEEQKLTLQRLKYLYGRI